MATRNATRHFIFRTARSRSEPFRFGFQDATAALSLVLGRLRVKRRVMSSVSLLFRMLAIRDRAGDDTFTRLVLFEGKQGHGLHSIDSPAEDRPSHGAV